MRGVGCVVQVTTQQMNDTCVYHPSAYVNEKTPAVDDTIKQSVIAEALTFVPGVMIEETRQANLGGDVISRKLVAIK